MRNTLFLLLLFPAVLSAQYFEPSRGRYVPPIEKNRAEYDINRTIATGMFGFMGGVVRDDSRRGKMVKEVIFFGTAVSIGLPGNGREKRPMKHILRDLCAGVAGASVGTVLKNNIRGWQ